MKILVLGGTGAMGEHLVQLLSNEGAEVLVTSRGVRTSEGKVRYVQGDAHDDKFLARILQGGWDAIVDFMVYTTESFERRVGQLLGGTSQYVFLSSARVYAHSKEPLTEDAPRLLEASRDEAFLATDEYALAKARQETILANSGRKNWTVIRPYITYSESRLQLGVLEKEEWLYRALQGRTIVFSEDINSRVVTLTYGLDVAKGIAAIIGKSETLGETFHITGSDAKTWSEVLAVYLDVLERQLGRRPKVLLQNIENFFKVHPKRYQIIYDRMFDRRFDNRKIGKYIDVKGFTAVEIGLSSGLEAFLKSPEFKNIDWRMEAIKDRQVKERAALREIRGVKHKLKYFLYRYAIV